MTAKFTRSTRIPTPSAQLASVPPICVLNTSRRPWFADRRPAGGLVWARRWPGTADRPVASIALALPRPWAPARARQRPSSRAPAIARYWAAMANAAASHVAEQDDVHNGSVFHPATVVFRRRWRWRRPWARQRARSADGLGGGLRGGASAWVNFWALALQGVPDHGHGGTLAAAAAVGHLLKLDAQQMLHALGSAGTQAAGLWSFRAPPPTANSCTPPTPLRRV